MTKYYYHRSGPFVMISNYGDTRFPYSSIYFQHNGFDFNKNYITRCMSPVIVNMINHNLHKELEESFLDLVKRDIKRIDKIQNKIKNKI